MQIFRPSPPPVSIGVERKLFGVFAIRTRTRYPVFCVSLLNSREIKRSSLPLPMSHRGPPSITPSECPVCGAEVPPRARACPHCGADEKTGWNEEATRYDGLDLPETAFEEGAPTRNDPSLNPRLRPGGISLLWWGTGLCIAFLITYLALSGRF